MSVAYLHILLTALICYVVNCFTQIHFDIFSFVSAYVCCIHKCVYLSNTFRNSLLFLESNHSKVCGKTTLWLPLFNISTPFPPFLGFKGPEGSVPKRKSTDQKQEFMMNWNKTRNIFATVLLNFRRQSVDCAFQD